MSFREENQGLIYRSRSMRFISPKLRRHRAQTVVAQQYIYDFYCDCSHRGWWKGAGALGKKKKTEQNKKRLHVSAFNRDTLAPVMRKRGTQQSSR